MERQGENFMKGLQVSHVPVRSNRYYGWQYANLSGVADFTHVGTRISGI